MPGAVQRREAAAWVCGAILANHALHAVRISSFESFAGSFTSFNLIFLFTCYVILKLTAEALPGQHRHDLAFALSAAALQAAAGVIGYRFGIGLVASYAGAYFYFTAGVDRTMRALGIVVLALSVHLLWGQILFQAFLPVFLRADAVMAGLVVDLAGLPARVDGMLISGEDGHRVGIVGGCSSFRNASLGAIAYVSAVMLYRRIWAAADYGYLAAVISTSVITNAARLAVLGSGRSYYDYWHEGDGVAVLIFVQTVLIAAVTLAGVRRPMERA